MQRGETSALWEGCWGSSNVDSHCTAHQVTRADARTGRSPLSGARRQIQAHKIFTGFWTLAVRKAAFNSRQHDWGCRSICKDRGCNRRLIGT